MITIILCYLLSKSARTLGPWRLNLWLANVLVSSASNGCSESLLNTLGRMLISFIVSSIFTVTRACFTATKVPYLWDIWIGFHRHNSYPIACTWGWDMWCILRIQSQWAPPCFVAIYAIPCCVRMCCNLTWPYLFQLVLMGWIRQICCSMAAIAHVTK